MKVLHVAPDERFIPFIQKVFKNFPGENRYFIYGVENDRPKFVTLTEGSKFLPKWYWFSSEMKRDMEWCDCLIVHYMHPFVARMVMAAPSHVKIVWSGWGGDYSKFISTAIGDLVMPQTKKLVVSRKSITQFLRNAAKKLLYATAFGYWEHRAICRVDYFSAPIPDDYDLLKKVLRQFRAKYVQLNYSDMEAMSEGLVNVTGNDILIGNSATPTNNHIEIFNLLRKLNLSGRKIIVPLNYGDISYGDKVEKTGREMFGEAFVPIRKMLPLDDYKKIVAKCEIVIMNHRRIQGGGSVVYSLYSGAKLYLNTSNSFLSFFRGHGACIFEIPENEVFENELFLPLTDEEKTKNREVLETFWGVETVKGNVVKLARTLQ